MSFGIGNLLVAMSGFVSTWMLWWSAAAAIPLVLHFLYRRRQHTSAWAAMRLLQQVIEKQSRRLRIEQMILLAIRTLILLLLAFALAQPFLQPSQEGTATTLQRPPKLWMLIVDNTYSMNYREADLTRFESARQRAIEIVKLATKGDAFCLITMATPARSIIARPTFDSTSTQAEIQKLETVDTGADLGQTLSLINSILLDVKGMTDMPKDIQAIFLSDFGTDTWQAAIEKGAYAKAIKTLATEHAVAFESFANAAGLSNSGPQPSNAAIIDFEPASTRALKEQSLPVNVTVANYGPAALTQLPVQLTLAGQTTETQFVDIAPGATINLQMHALPSSAGQMTIAANIRRDRLDTDDHRDAIIEVRAAYRVLIIEPIGSDGKILKAALRPDPQSSGLEIGSANLIELSALDLDNWDVLVLNDIAALADVESQRMKAFVERGGQLICLLGASADSANWNLRQDLLGFELLSPSEVGQWNIDPLEYRSPIVAPFASFPDAGLLTTPVFVYWKTRINEAMKKDIQVELGLQNGDALIVRHPVANGSVASWLSAPQTGNAGANAWNAVAAWPSFVPLIQGLVKTSLNSAADPHNLAVGQMLTGKCRPIGKSSVQLSVISPVGQEEIMTLSEMDSAGDFAWSYSATMHHGIYSASADGMLPQTFAVNIDPKQSSLSSIPLNSLPKSVDHSLASAVGSGVSTESTSSQRQTAITRWLLITLAIALVFESTLAWLLGRRIG